MTNLLDTSAPAPPERPARPPSAVRSLWKVFAAMLVLGAFTWGTFQVVTLIAHEERTERTAYDAAAITGLDVDSAAGSVTVLGGDTDEIVVTARISDGLRSTGESQRVVGGVLELRTTCPNFGSDWCRVSYDVVVPRDLDVTIDADNGSVDLRSLSGTVTATTDNGGVEGEDLRAEQVTADSDNGRVALTFTAAPRAVVATSNNGSVEVVVPNDGVAYRLDMDTDNGSQNLDLPTDPSSTRSLTLRTDNGSVTARTTSAVPG